jgi:hypothetical protein
VWPEDSALLKWANLVTEALGKIGRRSDAAALYKDQMIAAGFVNVVETKYMWPLVCSICILFRHPVRASELLRHVCRITQL